MFAAKWLLINGLVIASVVLGAIGVGHAAPASAWCRYRGEANCSVLGSGSGGVTLSPDEVKDRSVNKGRGSGRVLDDRSGR